jgi:hypothetical protein
MELFPSLEALKLYEICLLPALAAAGPVIFQLVSSRSLRECPATACVVGILVSVALSHVIHASLGGAIEDGVGFFKILLYYLLLVAVLDTPERLRSFLLWICIFIVIIASLALLHYFHVIDIPSLEPYHEGQEAVDEETGEQIVLARLQSVGIYANPNDLSRILVIGILISVYWMGDARLGLCRFLWLLPIALFVRSLQLTYSRGGLLSLMAGLVPLLIARSGKKGLVTMALAAPLLLIVFGGRQASLDTSGGTGYQRIGIWDEGLELFRESPIFGIGMGQYSEKVGIVAHNSFVQCYTEIGFVGGTLFVGAFYLPARALGKLGEPGARKRAPEMERLRPYLIAATAATCMGMMSSTRSYIQPTYLIVALNACYLRIEKARTGRTVEPFSLRLLRHLAIVSAIVLAAHYIYVRAKINHG